MPENFPLYRALIGLWLFVDAFIYLPYASLFFGKGYHDSPLLRRRGVLVGLWVVWLVASSALIGGVAPLVASFLLLVFCRYFFIRTRWSSLLRGGGVPGYMSHYAVAIVFFVELAMALEASGALARQTIDAFRLDFGLILICAGTYKTLSGYLRGEGAEFALVNPLWSYNYKFFRTLSPSHWWFFLENVGASLGEIAIGLLLVVPVTRAVGAFACIAAFLTLLPQIRLGRLIGIMVSIPLLFLPALPWQPPQMPLYRPVLEVASLATAMSYFLFAYIVLLPIVKITQYLNLFANITFPQPFQRWLTTYASLMPIVMWRVFTADITNFYVEAEEIDPATGLRRELLGERSYSYADWPSILRNWRFHQVAESAVIAAVFTARKYFRSKPEIFQKKLIRYAGTLTQNPNAHVVFRYISIRKTTTAFEFVPATEFTVDLSTGAVFERALVEGMDTAAPAQFSHIRESAGYGTYAKRGGS